MIGFYLEPSDPSPSYWSNDSPCPHQCGRPNRGNQSDFTLQAILPSNVLTLSEGCNFCVGLAILQAEFVCFGKPLPVSGAPMLIGDWDLSTAVWYGGPKVQMQCVCFCLLEV